MLTPDVGLAELPLRRYIMVHSAFAVAALIASVVFQTVIVRTNWLLVLDAILLVFMAVLVWIWFGVAKSTTQTTLVRLCVASFGLAFALVLFEQWFIHLTPLIVILPMMMATGEFDVDRYSRFVRLAVAVIIVTTFTSRRFPTTPLYPLTADVHRTAVALTFTPAFVAFISWVAWRNHATIRATTERLEVARSRLRQTESDVQNELRAKVAPVQRVTHRAAASLADCAAQWRDSSRSPDLLRADIAPIRSDVHMAHRELRRISSDLDDDPLNLSASDRSDAEPLDGDAAPDSEDEQAGDREPTLVVAIQMTIAFSLACFAVVALMYWFVDELRAPLVLAMLGLLAVAQLAPSVAARLLVERRPVVAIYLVSFALWVPPIVVGYKFSLVKAIFVPAMLIPIVISLPYLDRARVAALSAAASAAIAAMIAVARLSADAPVGSRSPDAVNDATVILLLPLGTFVVLWLANRNHLALLSRNRELKRSQRQVQRSYQQVRQRLQRDLHDGSQQRLISALIRLSIAENSAGVRSDDGAENLVTASEELGRAASILATLKFGPNRAMTSEQFKAELHLLAGPGTSATITTSNLPRVLPAKAVDVLWYGCAEALANTLKHAGPDPAIAITLTGTASGGICLTFVDDGCGFDPTEQGDGTGLSNIRARFGGHLDVTSSPATGTTLHGCVAADDLTGEETPVIDLREGVSTGSARTTS